MDNHQKTRVLVEGIAGILGIIIYIVFPLFFAKKHQFESDKMFVISGTSYRGYTIVVEMIVPPLAPILMVNFWWLFIFDLLILTGKMTVLIKILN
jgi:hypothetical protein